MGSERIASYNVRMIDKTYFGRTLFIATRLDNGEWEVTGSYPAVGCDTIDFVLAKVTEDLSSVSSLRRWVADNFEVIEPEVAMVRRKRFALRQDYFQSQSEA